MSPEASARTMAAPRPASPDSAPQPLDPAPSPGVARAGLFTLAFGRAYVITMRPYLLFLSGITGIAGLALGPVLPAAAAAWLALAFFLSYGFGQALTDCFQTDTDALSSPYRPLVRGEVSKRQVATVSLAGLAGIGFVLFRFHPLNLPLAAVEIAGLATYTTFKRRWWGGPFYNAWIVAGLVVMGYVSAHGGAGVPLAGDLRLAAAAAVAFFAYADFVLTGYFKDVSADRATGYRTLPVVFGLPVAARVSDGFAVLAVLASGGAWWLAARSGSSPEALAAAAAFMAAGALALARGHLRLHRVRQESDAHRAIAPVVHAHILLLSGVAASARPTWIPGLVLFYLAFVLVLRVRPMKEQI